MNIHLTEGRAAAHPPPRSILVGNSPAVTARTTNTAPDAPRIPLSSPMISKRIVACHNNSKNNNTRRRTIFPFLPKTPEEPRTGSPVGSRPPEEAFTSGQKSSDRAQDSPRLVCEIFDDLVNAKEGNQKDDQPTVPSLRHRVEPRLLPRESTLSSHEEIPPAGLNKRIVSFGEKDSTNSFFEDSSDACAKNVDSTDMPMPRSILRTGRRNRRVIDANDSVEKVSSVESDLPSLAGSSQSDSCEELRRIFPAAITVNKLERATSVPNRVIAFDPRVWIREFERTDEERGCTWYSNRELEHFKLAAIERIIAFGEAEIVSTGTGRIVTKRNSAFSGKAIFSHQALGTDKEEVKKEALFHAVLQNELRRVLVVDSHEVFLNLFSKTLRPLLPHAEIVLAGSAAPALQEAGKGRFDLILVEERLKLLNQAHSTTSSTSPSSNIQNPKITFHHLPTEEESRSGSALMKRLQTKQGRALFVGVSARLREDLPNMQDVSDVCWSKPPPHMNYNLVRDLLHKLLIKRQRFQAVAELYS